MAAEKYPLITLLLSKRATSTNGSYDEKGSQYHNKGGCDEINQMDTELMSRLWRLFWRNVTERKWQASNQSDHIEAPGKRVTRMEKDDITILATATFVN